MLSSLVYSDGSQPAATESNAGQRPGTSRTRSALRQVASCPVSAPLDEELSARGTGRVFEAKLGRVADVDVDQAGVVTDHEAASAPC